jgi:hypothetical protein
MVVPTELLELMLFSSGRCTNVGRLLQPAAGMFVERGLLVGAGAGYERTKASVPALVRPPPLPTRSLTHRVDATHAVPCAVSRTRSAGTQLGAITDLLAGGCWLAQSPDFIDCTTSPPVRVVTTCAALVDRRGAASESPVIEYGTCCS